MITNILDQKISQLNRIICMIFLRLNKARNVIKNCARTVCTLQEYLKTCSLIILYIVFIYFLHIFYGILYLQFSVIFRVQNLNATILLIYYNINYKFNYLNITLRLNLILLNVIQNEKVLSLLMLGNFFVKNKYNRHIINLQIYNRIVNSHFYVRNSLPFQFRI